LQIANGSSTDPRNVQVASRRTGDSARHSKPAAAAWLVLGEAAENPMADCVLVVATAAFFALCWGYVRLCEKL
jgi:hypothetical protein